MDTLLKVMTGEPQLPRKIDRTIPRALQLITMKCLSKSPGGRYESAGHLADDAERYVRGESIEVRPPSIYERLLRWTRREPALAGRLGILGMFLAIEMINYHRGAVLTEFHDPILKIMGVWVVAWFLCQQLLRVRSLALPAHVVWSMLDMGMMLVVLLKANGVASPLILGLPLLIAGSGLWLRERFVWMMTTMAIGLYLAMVVDFYYRRTDLHANFDTALDRHMIFVVMLIGVGGCVGYLVHRVRTLSRVCRRDDELRQ